MDINPGEVDLNFTVLPPPSLSLTVSPPSSNSLTITNVGGPAGKDGVDGQIQSVAPGSFISIDSSDSANPIISAMGLVPTSRSINGYSLASDINITKSDLDLSNVDNTSDAAKPISTAVQAALNAKQPLDSDLTTIAALTPTTDNFMVSNSGAWASRTPSQARVHLGLGSIAMQAASSVAITGGSITGITDLAVADGGTGSSSASGARSNLAVGEASGWSKMSVGTVAPSSPTFGDIWVDSN